MVHCVYCIHISHASCINLMATQMCTAAAVSRTICLAFVGIWHLVIMSCHLDAP